MSKIQTGLGLALLLVAGPAAAAEGSGSEGVDIPFETFTLDNGLKVIVHEDHSVPVVHSEIWYHVGSRNEAEGLTGFAHLFEHLMFQGSAHYDDEYFGPLQEVGANVNGSTNFDRTNYFEVLPSNYLDLALYMEADRMGWLLPALTQEKLDNQREVVKNERRQRYENQPYGMMRWWVNETIYPEGHPYHHLTIGSQEDLTRASLDDVKGFFSAYYLPNNATLCIAGDVSLEEVKRSARRYFADIPRGADVPGPELEPVTLDHEIHLVKEDAVSLARMNFVYPSPAIFQPGDADLDILSSILTDGLNSRLYNALVYKGQQAQTVRAYHGSARLTSLYVIDVMVAGGHTPEEIEGVVDEVLADIAKNGVTEAEVQTAINGWESQFVFGLESISSKASQLCAYDFSAGDAGFISKDLARYQAVTPASVQQAVQTFLKKDGRLVLTVVPKGQGDGGAP